MADFGASIGIELVKFIITEVKKHKKQVELANSCLGTYILSISEAQITADMNMAKLIEKDPAVSTKIKEDVVHAHDEVLKRLKEIRKDLEEYVNSGFWDGIKKKRALRRLDKGSQKLKDEMSIFQTLVLSLSHNSPAKEHQLSEQDFTFIAGNRRVWITATAFTADAWLSRQIRGVSTGRHAFILEYKAYKAKEKESSKLDVVLLNQRLAAADRTKGIPNVLGFRDEPEDDGSGEFQSVWSTNRPTQTGGFGRSV